MFNKARTLHAFCYDSELPKFKNMKVLVDMRPKVLDLNAAKIISEPFCFEIFPNSIDKNSIIAG